MDVNRVTLSAIYLPANLPKAILLAPEVIEDSDACPIALLAPPVLFCSEPCPIAVFAFPLIFEPKPLDPIATLLAPIVFKNKALVPIDTLLVPVVFEVKDDWPTVVLLLMFPPPLPTVCPLIRTSPFTSKSLAGAVVPIPTLPAEVMRMRSKGVVAVVDVKNLS